MEKDKRYSYGTVREIREDVDETRTVSFTASTSTRDSHGTVLNQENWTLERFNSNPIIGYQHNVYGNACGEDDPDDIIGKGRAFVEDGKLITDITFDGTHKGGTGNEKAEKIFQKVKKGFINAVSVGFQPTGIGSFGEGDQAEGQADQTYHFDGQELLEISLVNIPSNAESVKKALRTQTTEALLFVHRELNISFSEIEKMTVEDILKALDNRNKPVVIIPVAETVNNGASSTVSWGSAEIESKEKSVDNIKDLKLKHEHLNIKKGWISGN